MGIDIYVRWNKQTEKEKDSQYTGFSVTAGNVGYLREAYHGKPYATKVLVKEAFESSSCEAKIPAKVLRKRLPEVIKLVIQRAKEVYHTDIDENSPEVQSFKDFVDLCERKEKEQGEPVTIVASY
jgi:hypothetical protein